jgi:hypothetical protein
VSTPVLMITHLESRTRIAGGASNAFDKSVLNLCNQANGLLVTHFARYYLCG